MLTDEQKQFVTAQTERGYTDYYVAKMLGISRSAVRNYIEKRTRQISRELPHFKYFAADPRPVMTDNEKKEWMARKNLVPRDLTAALMGDPLPGCSALERR